MIATFSGVPAGGSAPSASFSATLLSTLVPQVYTGSSTPTFTRATTAYVSDFEGLLKQVPSGASRHTGARFVRNFVPLSEIGAALSTWNLNAITRTGSISDPLGGTTAATLTATAASNNTMYMNPGAAGTLPTATFSVWLRRRTGTGVIRMAFDSGSIANTTVTLTSSWQRFSITGAMAATQPHIYIDTNADAIDVWGLQLENVTGQSNQNPSEYVSVGVLSAPYHGAGVDGCKYFTTQNGNTVASNVVTEATGAAISSATLLGYQAEGARTNRCLQSQVFSNAAWVSGGGGIAVTNNSIAAPDGTTTADTLTASGANGTLIQDLGTVASAAKAGGLWIKRKTGTGNVDLTLDGGATWTNITVTAGWTRVQKTQTLADEDFGIRIVTSGDEVYAWQGQVETASFLSSDIPTTTVAVARNADVLSYSSASNIDSTLGSAILGYTPSVTLPGIVSLLSSASVNNSVLTQRGNTVATYLQTYDATNNPLWTVSAFAAATACKVGTAWGGLTQQSYKDGALGTGAATTFDGNFNLGANFSVGAENSIVQPFGCIRNIAIYATKKTDAEMQTATT